MQPSVRSLVGLAAVAAVAVAVAACGSASSAIPTPSARPSPSPAASASAPSPAGSPSSTGSGLGPVASTFSSPMYGYAIGLPAGWTATAATTVADDPAGTEDTHADRFVVPGTDTTITVYALDLGSQTYEEWAKEVHDDMVANLPSGCDGGDPSTWPDVPVGSAQGHWLRKCNEAVALVPLGKRIYVFVWGHETFEEMRHLPESSFKEFLLGVRLPDAATAEKPLWSPPP